MRRKLNHFLDALLIIVSLCVAGCGDGSTAWYTGKWEGKTNNSAEYFTVKIKPDGTCKILQEWRGLERWYEDFDGEWEKVSDDIIKIYDYDGHMHVSPTSNHPHRNYRVARWSMHLRKDGAFTQKVENLDYPTAHLTKK